MGDVAHHGREQAAERAFHHRLVERGMADAGADAQLAVLDRQPRERLDSVDVDEVRGAGETKGHDRDKALPARQHAPVLGRDLGQGLDRLDNGFGRVVAKRRGLHVCWRCDRSADGRRSGFPSFLD